MSAKLIDIQGERFGRLVITGRSQVVVSSGSAWDALCDCGKAVVVRSGDVRRGKMQSCGCLKAENTAKINPQRAITTYKGMHIRIARLRGKAAEHKCKCGEQAAEWSYNHSDPNELKHTQQYGKNLITVAYSMDVDRYDALCKSCHRKRDRWER